ncbi:coniferyl aldehyde dehydrogenase [Pseudoduganella aquatica]|uniref:Aldehyde dehydrogenase n=1 Tax=Pseudoduganella aquatica TaxID=2660641 RepID=A0A7X4HEQ5_9BURK|nr:coniferyl aldehyde dehydrogenase [Pseudoduganella aquatica]MYN09906.1 aldehyde dehydrogenase family protein [Pseudoduganella aquatica]
MHPHADPAPSAAEERARRLFAAQQQAYAAAPYPSAAQRRAALQALKRQIQRYQDALAAAMHADFGYRAVAESKMLDLLASTLEINHAISHVRKWMNPSRRRTELLFLSNSVTVRYQPKGVVGVIVPWNFPVYLALGPLAAALAAGNRVMLKLSELTPATNAVLRRMLGEIFAEEQVAVLAGELDDPTVFTALPFNHLVFTGSPAVGKLVMQAAARNLTPVTLELGGKSPALLLRNYNVAEAARRVVHGKSANSGQICVAPDYALVPRESVQEFAAAAQLAYAEFHETGTRAPEYTAIISPAHHARLRALLDEARERGATVLRCGEGSRLLLSARQMPLHLVLGADAGMRVMREEIFGPVLPIVPYDTLEEAIAFINAAERPLALYCFGHDAAQRDEVLRRTHSGGVTVNDWGWHVINHDAPFGGVGNSGMGNYHGEEGFRELSHAKTVFKRHRFFPIDLFYPPYGNVVQRLALRVFLGKGDPGVAPRIEHGKEQA